MTFTEILRVLCFRSVQMHFPPGCCLPIRPNLLGGCGSDFLLKLAAMACTAPIFVIDSFCTGFAPIAALLRAHRASLRTCAGELFLASLPEILVTRSSCAA